MYEFLNGGPSDGPDPFTATPIAFVVSSVALAIIVIGWRWIRPEGGRWLRSAMLGWAAAVLFVAADVSVSSALFARGAGMEASIVAAGRPYCVAFVTSWFSLAHYRFHGRSLGNPAPLVIVEDPAGLLPYYVSPSHVTLAKTNVLFDACTPFPSCVVPQFGQPRPNFLDSFPLF